MFGREVCVGGGRWLWLWLWCGVGLELGRWRLAARCGRGGGVVVRYGGRSVVLGAGARDGRAGWKSVGVWLGDYIGRGQGGEGTDEQIKVGPDASGFGLIRLPPSKPLTLGHARYSAPQYGAATPKVLISDERASERRRTRHLPVQLI